jgi:acetyl esterase/lipase
MLRPLAALVVLLAVPLAALAQPAEAKFTLTEDVIYGRKHGMALVMDVYTPKENANGAGVVFCLSGGWFSGKALNPFSVPLLKPLVERGYTVFAVAHGSQPKFTIPEVLEDMHRAVRFIRANAEKYKIDPDRIGISGGSAGGHLSLMQGNAPLPGNPVATDSVDRVSSKVQAVGCFFPPTDFLNYGKKGEIALGNGTLVGFRPPFEFWERDPLTNAIIIIPYEAKRREIGKKISPVYHVSKNSAPALIIHGDADKLVPIQQAELMVEAYKKVGVPCELVVKKDAVHGWTGMDKDMTQIADWFDEYLPKK